MATWVTDERYRYVWITVFLVLIVMFNVLNVRRFGEIEYWMTVIKLATIVGIIILGFLLPMGVSTDTRQLATIGNDTAPCPSPPANDTCLPLPGFDCTSSSILQKPVVDIRLENRSRFQELLLPRRFRQPCRFLGRLLSSCIVLYGSRNNRHRSRRNRTSKRNFTPCSPSRRLPRPSVPRSNNLCSRLERLLQ